MLTTVQRVLSESKAADTSPATISTTQINNILAAITKVTKRLKAMAWDFEPFYATEFLTASMQNTSVGDGKLTLFHPKKGQLNLLYSATDVPVVTVNGQTLSFGLVPGNVPQVLPCPINWTPTNQLRLNDANNSIYQSWYPTNLPWYDNISIAGWWGYRRGYFQGEGLVNSLDSVQDNPLSATATTMTILSSAGADAIFYAPRFSPGNLLRIDNELLLVLATTTTTLSVRRGVNGTTAAQHNQGAAIYIWYPEEDVMHVVSRQAAYFYARRGSFEETAIQGITTAVYPKDLVNELWATLQGFENE